MTFFIFLSGQAQISGVIKDKSNGKSVAGADVFINNSSWRTTTDKEGAFALIGLDPSFMDVVVYKKGFTVFKSSFRVQENKEYKLALEIVPEAPGTNSGKTKKDEDREKNLEWFTIGLLGSDDFARSCKIENSKSIQFQRIGESLLVTCNEPIKIENTALGYQLTLFLREYNANAHTATYQALTYYTKSASEDFVLQSQWERNRLKAFWGSSRHLFQSLVDGTTVQDGFLLFDQEANALAPKDIVTTSKIPGYGSISFARETKVIFNMEPTITGVVTSEVASQSSTIVPLASVDVTRKGILFNSQSVTIKGSMANEKLGSSLPIDYEPTASLEEEKVDWKNFSLLREKVYLQTDRDYYYPRETIWLKAYLGYSMLALRDTLSQTLYVELISPEKVRIDSKIYPIKEGVAWGDFRLSEDLPTGQYYLRAYTNWMRNYGDSSLFVKTIPILKVDENVELQNQQFQNSISPEVAITINKNSFKAREPVELSVQIKDENGKFVKSNLSVAVVDAVVSVPLSPLQITNSKVLKVEPVEAPNKYFEQISYFMERGISFQGVVKDSKNVAAPARLEIIQGNMDNLISMETDEQGEFLVTGVKFNDSLVFAFKPFNKKGKLFLGRVDLLPREIPSLNFELKPLDLKLKKEDALQRIQNSYNPDEGVTMLKEVEVKSSKLAKTEPTEAVRIYGSPDYVVTGDNIRSTVAGTNFLVGLQGKVPGLRVIQNADGVISVRVGRASSFSSSTEPVILVDGVLFPDAQSISALSPSMVDRVEVVTRASPQYGSRGSNGVIAIYTKSGFSAQTPEPNYLSYKIPGYNKPRTFFSPDYSITNNSAIPDFRTTIFWRPDLKTDERGVATCRFYTADLATRYRIVVEGITEKGTPVRSVSYISVE